MYTLEKGKSFIAYGCLEDFAPIARQNDVAFVGVCHENMDEVVRE